MLYYYVALHTGRRRRRSTLTVSDCESSESLAIGHGSTDCGARRRPKQQQLWKVQDADSRYTYIRSYQWKREDDVATHFRPFRTLVSVMP